MLPLTRTVVIAIDNNQQLQKSKLPEKKKSILLKLF